MRLLVAGAPLKRILRGMERGLIASGVALLAYCAVSVIGTHAFQQRASIQFAASPPSPLAIIAPNGLIGRIEIPRLGLSAMISEGTSAATLRRAVGHVPRTALPGQSGNVAIAGHRDTFFRPLRDIRPNDIITLATLNGEYRYRVVWTRVVPSTEVSVLDPSRFEILTLVTCYPFSFIGAAPDRFIVRAERMKG